MTSARDFARIFAAAAGGCMTPFGMGSQQPYNALHQGGSFGQTLGPSYSTESYDRAKMMQGVFSAIAEVYRGIAEAEDAAQTIEARRGETEGLDAKRESVTRRDAHG